MNTFDEREKGYETKFSRDQDLMFRIQARRDKMLGHWAAEKLGITGDGADAYARELVMLDIEAPGDQIVVDKVLADFEAKGVDISAHILRKQMDELSEEAHKQLMAE